MNMTYDNLYEYAPPPVKAIKQSDSQTLVVFWALVILFILYQLWRAFLKRRGSISEFLSGMWMPDQERQRQLYHLQ